jgi:hypothetical protein
MTETTLVTVRPRRSLLTTAFLSIALAMIPVFGVLYWFSVQHDSWLLVFVVHVAVVVLCGAALLRQLTVFSAVSATEILGRGIFSPLERVPLDRVHSVHLVETYSGGAADSVTQLLVCDAEGRRLFRMRGTFWHPEDLRAIADALPVPLEVVKHPISMDEFYRTYPNSAYWFERRPLLKFAAYIGAVIVALLASAWVMTILGMPLGF